MTKTYIAPGKRTPFVKAGTHYAKHQSLALSIPVAQAMGNIAEPDFISWGQVIPSAEISNFGRELSLEAGLNPDIAAYGTVMACSTSMMGTIQASGMVGRGGNHLAMVGGVESMSHVPIALHPEIAQKLIVLFSSDPAAAQAEFGNIGPRDFNLPTKGWANRISGRSMGDHTEDTAKFFAIAREAQDDLAYKSHKNSTDAQSNGFFDDLIIEFDGVDKDTIPRADSTLEKLASLKPVFDTSGQGTLTAGNSSPLTDGAGGLWVGDEQGIERVGSQHVVELVDWQMAAMDYREEGILMAPARAMPRLLARHKLRLEDIAMFEIHEAFAAQVLANVKAITDATYRKEKAGVDMDLGDFPWERLNRHGGSMAIGHPFGATGARILSQAAKILSGLQSGDYGIVSICADGGQGTVCLLRKP